MQKLSTRWTVFVVDSVLHFRYMSENINEEQIYATGAEPSPVDERDFIYIPDKANIKGGQRYQTNDIEDQHRVGICTAISLTQNARKATKQAFSADFQYLLQKKFHDKNWNEGSSARASLFIAKNYGLLPAYEWTHTTLADRKLSYANYIKKLQDVPDAEIERLLKIAAAYKIAGYAQVPVDRDLMATAIDESAAGLITRFVVGREWFTAPVEPLRKAVTPISGHLITISNYDGNSYRVANTWGDDWADNGTAYGSLLDNPPTEAWIPYYNKLPAPIEEQKKKLTAKQEKELKSLQNRVLTLLKKIGAILNLAK
jgi:hypothetical protein